MSIAFDKRVTAARADLAALSLRGKVEADRFVEGRRKVVSRGVADLRRTPNHGGSLETQAIFGEPLTAYDERDGWSWVQLDDDGYVGYLSTASLNDLTTAPTHRVAVARTFLYGGADIKIAGPAGLPRGARLAVTGFTGDFADVAGGGHLWRSHLTPIDSTETDFVAVAETYLHAPYLWGGKTSSGIDCSALVQVSLTAAGVAVPRDSDMQEREVGAAVAVDEALDGLARGDLVFWKGHVGVMRDAETLLHASGHHMLVASEPLRAARDRILARSFGPITSVKRLVR